MRKRKRHLGFLISALASLGIFFYIIVSHAPSEQFSIFPAERDLASQDNFRIPILLPFFILLFIFIYSLIRFILKSSIHAVLAAIFVVAYLFLRMNNLTHPFFLFLLVAVFLTFELFFSKRS